MTADASRAFANSAANSAGADATSKKSREDWARIWFSQLAQFHQGDLGRDWHFDEAHVIAFLRSKVKAGVPAWKRLKAVEGLITYRNRILKSKQPRLEHIRTKLQEIVIQEKFDNDGGPEIEELVGQINPREPDVIQKMRRTLRVQGKEYNTEKAYVKWARRFMQARCLKNLADFDDIHETDIERKRGQEPIAGTALRVLRTIGS